MRFELRRLESYDDASLISEMKRVAALVEAPIITYRDFDRLSKVASSTIRRRFGSWQQALVRAGLGHRYSGTRVSLRMLARGRRTFSDEELLAEIRSVASKLDGGPVTMQAFSDHAHLNPETVRRRFGSWSKALDGAGLEISKRGKRYSESDYFENLLAVWTHYGRQPTYSEMDRHPSRIPARAYEARWKTWRKALTAFIDHANRDVTNEPDLRPRSPRPDTKHPPLQASEPARHIKSPRNSEEDGDVRSIRIALRYKVLKRDGFRCVRCGASPATRIGCELHVDHIVPFSRGGRTIFENLRTLCSDCNVGKGAQID